MSLTVLTIASALSVSLALTPVATAAPPAAPTAAPHGEGPSAAPTAETRWLRRDRRLRGATFSLVGITGASLIGVAAGAGVLASHHQHALDGSGESKGLAVASVLLGASIVSLAISGGLWTAHRDIRPASLEPRPPPPPVLAADDPRRDPAWVARDRRLTKATIGTGVSMGIALASLGIALGTLFAPCDNCDDDTGPAVASISLGAIAGLLAIPFIAVAFARGVHRMPLHQARARVAGPGLRVNF